MDFPQGAWFWLVLVKIPVSSLEVLRDQNRIPMGERITVKVDTRTVPIARYPGREANGAYGIIRVKVNANEDSLAVRWNKKVRGRNMGGWLRVHLDSHIVQQFGTYIVLAQAFNDEKLARAWAKERHATPLP